PAAKEKGVARQTTLFGLPPPKPKEKEKKTANAKVKNSAIATSPDDETQTSQASDMLMSDAGTLITEPETQDDQPPGQAEAGGSVWEETQVVESQDMDVR
ncbi:hypothetical protein DXG03_006887, partial [Asterophora parasitica]